MLDISRPLNLSRWTQAQVVSWAQGLPTVFKPFHINLLWESQTGGQWLTSYLTTSDLEKLGVPLVGEQMLILEAVERLREAFAFLTTDTLQNVFFRLVRSAATLSSVLKMGRTNMGREKKQDHHLLFSASVQFNKHAKETGLWLSRVPFAPIPMMVTLKAFLLKQVAEVNQLIQMTLKSPLEDNTDDILEAVRVLRERFEEMVKDCYDSLMLTPCTIEFVHVRKEENVDFGFNFRTTSEYVHIIDSIDAESPAFSCGKISKDDEIIEVNDQLVLGWEHECLLSLLQQNSRHVTLGIRKRPAHFTDRLSSGRRNRIILANNLRQATAGPRSNFLQNRTPKRRTQPIRSPTGGNTLSQASFAAALESPNIVSPGSTLLQAHKSPPPPRKSSSRVHSRPRRDRFCQPLQNKPDSPVADDMMNKSLTEFATQGSPTNLTLPSAPDRVANYLLESAVLNPHDFPLSTSNEEVEVEENENSSSSSLPAQSDSEKVDNDTIQIKIKRRPVTLGSMNEVSQNPISDWNSKPNIIGVRVSSPVRGRGDSQGWLWLKKRSSIANKYVKRWCVFKHNTLYYYLHQNEDLAEGLILLHGFTISPMPESRYGRFSFHIYNDWASFIFAADSEQSRTQWMNRLGLAAIGLTASNLQSFSLLSNHQYHRSEQASPKNDNSESRQLVIPRPLTAGPILQAVESAKIHRCVSSLAVPTTPKKRVVVAVGNMSVSTSCLMNPEPRQRAENEDSEKEDNNDDKNDKANFPPCRLIRQPGMIRRSCEPRFRRLTDGSISPSVYLTTPSATPTLLCASQLHYRHSTDCNLNLVSAFAPTDSQLSPLVLTSSRSSNSSEPTSR